MAIETYFQNIANAIREKTGNSGLITPAQMPSEIAGIETGVPIHTGYTDPSNSLGENGDLYLKLYHTVLPNGYKELEYIENIGGSYIDTGYIPNNNSDIIMDCLPHFSPNSAPTAFGCRTGSSGKRFYIFTSHDQSNPMYSFNSSEKYFSGNPQWEHRIELRLNKNIAKFGNLSDTPPQTEFTSDYSMYLFTLNQSGGDYGSVTWCYLRLFSCKVLENDVLIHHYIPAKRESDSKIGVYDNVANVFYERRGNTEFTLGTEITENGVNEVFVKDSNSWRLLKGYVWS